MPGEASGAAFEAVAVDPGARRILSTQGAAPGAAFEVVAVDLGARRVLSTPGAASGAAFEAVAVVGPVGRFGMVFYCNIIEL